MTIEITPCPTPGCSNATRWLLTDRLANGEPVLDWHLFVQCHSCLMWRMLPTGNLT